MTRRHCWGRGPSWCFWLFLEINHFRDRVCLLWLTLSNWAAPKQLLPSCTAQLSWLSRNCSCLIVKRGYRCPDYYLPQLYYMITLRVTEHLSFTFILSGHLCSDGNTAQAQWESSVESQCTLRLCGGGDSGSESNHIFLQLQHELNGFLFNLYRHY